MIVNTQSITLNRTGHLRMGGFSAFTLFILVYKTSILQDPNKQTNKQQKTKAHKLCWTSIGEDCGLVPTIYMTETVRTSAAAEVRNRKYTFVLCCLFLSTL